MIVRRWEARTTTEGADRYQAHFATVVLEKLKPLDGFRGAQILRAVDAGADHVKLIDLTYWESLDSISAFAGADLRTAVVDETARRYLVDFDRSVSHYSVELDTITGSARAGT
jgi:heme-degrading monooxygenase HmoA